MVASRVMRGRRCVSALLVLTLASAAGAQRGRAPTPLHRVTDAGAADAALSPMQRAQQRRHTTTNEVDRNGCIMDALSADPRFRQAFERDAPGSDDSRPRALFVVPPTGALARPRTLPPVDVEIGGVRGRLFRAPMFYHLMHCQGGERRAGESVDQCARRIFWAPSRRDIAAFEEAFARTDPRDWQTPRSDAALRARLHSYRREYFGIVLRGERLVSVGLFCPALRVMNDDGVTLADDGGDCVLSATLFPDGTLRVWANGSA